MFLCRVVTGFCYQGFEREGEGERESVEARVRVRSFNLNGQVVGSGGGQCEGDAWLPVCLLVHTPGPAPGHRVRCSHLLRALQAGSLLVRTDSKLFIVVISGR